MPGLKVIAGSHRGRVLRTPVGLATRPTSGRVREALFSMLGDLSDLSVLDLYAGSGALGIEALSRGAKRAVFVESGKAALACIRENLATLDLEARSKVLSVRVEAAKKPLAAMAPFALVLCDPPWADMAATVRELERWVVATCLEPGGRLVLEHAAKHPPAHLQSARLDDQRAWGDTGISIFSRVAE